MDTEERNFILPETEGAIQAIITEAVRFFDAARIVVTVLYLFYLSLRVALFSAHVWVDICLLTLYAVQCVLLALEILERFKPQKSALVLVVAKRLASLVMFVLVAHDIFVARENTQFWQIIMCILMGIGWLVMMLGNLFLLTVPRYAEMILSSFKRDIELAPLVSRGMNEAKTAAKNAAREVFHNEYVQNVAKTGSVIFSAGVLGKLAKKLLKVGKRIKL